EVGLDEIKVEETVVSEPSQEILGIGFGEKEVGEEVIEAGEIGAERIEEGIKESTQPVSSFEEFYEPVSFEVSEAEEEREDKIEKALEGLGESEKEDIKKVLLYLDSLLESLPEEKIKEFASSEYYDLYVKLFNKLNLK
ncbi:MAG: hypothetical protein ACP5KI_05355, partial [Brevinematia bacterium]